MAAAREPLLGKGVRLEAEMIYQSHMMRIRQRAPRQPGARTARHLCFADRSSPQ
jgi:hypothetical protein